ncbi:MAG: glycosyltransferase family 2 protein [Gemmatimonadaceae bacterium]
MSVSRVTVAVCTWNRQELLRQTLEEMTKLSIPAGLEWELVVVNNNCTDATDDVLASFASRLPIRRLFQPVPGLSNARNLVTLMKTGEYIIWTDDDVLVAPDWLQNYVKAFDALPEASVFGGPVEPWFPNTPPEWLEKTWSSIANAYASIDYGNELLPLSHLRVPFGANMALRADCMHQFPFNPALGIRPGSRMGGEETDVVRRALASGATGWWIPDARVKHYIPPARQTLKYLREWYYAYGLYLGQNGDRHGTTHLLGRPLWLWKQVMVREFRYQLKRHNTGTYEWMDDLIEASVARGQLRSFKRDRL